MKQVIHAGRLCGEHDLLQRRALDLGLRVWREQIVLLELGLGVQIMRLAVTNTPGAAPSLSAPRFAVLDRRERFRAGF